MLQRLLALSQKEFIQIQRDRRTLAMMIILPLLWLLLFGYAFTFDVKELTVAVVDQSGTTIGTRVADRLRGYERFQMVSLDPESEAGVEAAMQRDAVKLAVLLPEGFGTKADAKMRVLIDGSDLFAAQTGARLVINALEPLQSELRAEAMAQLAKSPMAAAVGQIAAPTAMTPELQILYNPDLKSAPVMIPGLLGMVVMFMTTMMTAMGVVREREYGTMEQLVVTPIRPIELMLGKLLPYFVIGCLDFALVFLAGLYLFGLTFAGNLPIFLGLSLLLVFTTLGLGLLISTVAQNQQQAMQLAMFAIMPQILVSGLIFPLSSLPKVIQYIAYLLPFTHYVPIARGMFIKGQDLTLLWPQAVVLTVYAVAMVVLASARFRKRLA